MVRQSHVFARISLVLRSYVYAMARKPPTIRDRIAERIRTRGTDVFSREEFAAFGAYDVIGRELRKLVGEGLLVQVGYGLYARAKPSVLSGKPIPASPLIDIGYQALRRLGYSPKPTQDALDYIEGRTTGTCRQPRRHPWCAREAQDRLRAARHRVRMKRLTKAHPS